VALNAVSVGVNAAGNQVRDKPAFDREKILSTQHGVIADRQRSHRQRQPAKDKQALLSGVHNYARPPVRCAVH